MLTGQTGIFTLDFPVRRRPWSRLLPCKGRVPYASRIIIKAGTFGGKYIAGRHILDEEYLRHVGWTPDPNASPALLDKDNASVVYQRRFYPEFKPFVLAL